MLQFCFAPALIANKIPGFSKPPMKEYGIFIFRNYNFSAASKAARKMIGLGCGPSRLPVQTLNESRLAELEEELENNGFFDYTFSTQIE